MPITPEDRARQHIDCLLAAAGWIIQDRRDANITAGCGVAVREFPMKKGHGEADYLLFVDGAAGGAIEAKPEGKTLTQVEVQTTKYSEGVPDTVPAPRRPLPFLYESTGVETRFTNLLEPDARSRQVFGFHRPETLAEWLEVELKRPGSTLRARSGSDVHLWLRPSINCAIPSRPRTGPQGESGLATLGRISHDGRVAKSGSQVRTLRQDNGAVCPRFGKGRGRRTARETSQRCESSGIARHIARPTPASVFSRSQTVVLGARVASREQPNS